MMIQPYAICQKYYRLEYDDMATIAFSNFYLPPSSHPFIWTLTSPSSSTSGESSQLSMWQYLRRGGTPHLPMLSPSWSMEKYSNYLDTLWSSWLSTNDYPQFSFIFCSLKGCKYVDYFQRISWSGQKHFNYTLGTMSSIDQNKGSPHDFYPEKSCKNPHKCEVKSTKVLIGHLK